MNCRPIIHPSKRIPASKDNVLRGLEIAPKSKSTDVYIVIRVNVAVALYLKALTRFEPFWGSVSHIAEYLVRTFLHERFCARGAPEERTQFISDHIIGQSERSIMVELLRD